MSTPNARGREQTGTYGVPKHLNAEEIKRLSLQNRLINTGLGGLLPEQPETARFSSVLDVGCGTGGWLIELAKSDPDITSLTGIDINEKIVAFARQQAAAEKVSNRVKFQAMDAIRALTFPDAHFDLINQRLAVSWLRTWDWTGLLREYLRVSRPGGMVRVTEMNFLPAQASSSALLQLCELMVKASYQAGHLYRPDGNSLLEALPDLLIRHGLKHVQSHPYTLEARGGTQKGDLLAEDMQRLFQNVKFFLNKWVRLPEDYDDICQRMAREMRTPDSVTISNFMTVWGKKEAS
jgi:SAM-dependent methyltransferase